MRKAAGSNPAPSTKPPRLASLPYFPQLIATTLPAWKGSDSGTSSQTTSGLIELVNPATGQVLQRVKPATREEVEYSIHLAQEEFKEWSQLRPADRGVYLEKAAKILRDTKQKLAETITREMGKIIRESVSEVEKCAWALDYYSENGPHFLAPESVRTDATDSYVAFEPLGVVASIMPWNFPVWQCIRFAAPTLMAGNTTVFKPSSTTPQSALSLQSAFIDAGMLPHCFNVVVGDSRIGQYMIESNGTSAVSFTGSVNAGQKVAEAASRHLKKYVLELGGSDPFIVLDDADIDAASSGAVKGRFINCGQSCIASKRFFVVKEVARDFIDDFVRKTKALRLGDPMKTETDIGPMVREEALEFLDSQVKDSIKQGAHVETGGKRVERPGFYYEPTVLTNIDSSMRVMTEETFGPVAPVMIVDNARQAVKMANMSEYGLGASVWGTNIRRAEEIAGQITSGLVTVNDTVVSDPRMPFGGVKKSGIGRELSRYGILEFTNIKSVRIYEKPPVSSGPHSE